MAGISLDPGTDERFARYLKRLLAGVAVVALVACALALGWLVRDVLLLVFAGLLVALLLRGPADWLAARTPLPAAAGVLLVFLLGLGALAAIGWWRGPEVVAEVGTLQDQVPRTLRSLEEQLMRYEWGEAAIEQMPDPAVLLPGERSTVSRITGVVGTTFNVVTNGFLILFLGVVLALQPRPYRKGLLALVPAAHRPRAREILDDLEHSLRRWLGAQLLAMTAVFVMTWVGLLLLDVPLAFTLALIAGLLEFVPFLGPLLSGVPAVMLMLVADPSRVWQVVLLYAGVQVVESWLLVPFLQWKAVWLPPALVVLVQLALGATLGLWGVTLAAPVTAVLMILTRELYVEEVLGEE